VSESRVSPVSGGLAGANFIEKEAENEPGAKRRKKTQKGNSG